MLMLCCEDRALVWHFPDALLLCREHRVLVWQSVRRLLCALLCLSNLLRHAMQGTFNAERAVQPCAKVLGLHCTKGGVHSPHVPSAVAAGLSQSTSCTTMRARMHRRARQRGSIAQAPSTPPSSQTALLGLLVQCTLTRLRQHLPLPLLAPQYLLLVKY